MPAPDGRLDSWKEIAHHFGRDVRTVQRWEAREGLPVHRHHHTRRGSVYAFAAELDAWWESRRALLDAGADRVPPVEQAVAAPATSPPAPAAAAPAARRAWRLAALALVAAAALGFLLPAWRSKGGGPATARGTTSVAVLPLRDLSGDPARAHVAEGVHEALLNELAHIGSLRVISRTSVVRFRDTREPLPAVARALGVDTVVEGSVSLAGPRVRVSLRAVDARTDGTLWAGAVDREMPDALALQAELAAQLAAALHVALAPGEAARLQGGRKVDPRAYDLYLQGRYLWARRHRREAEQALALYRQALEVDPGFAPAHVGLAETYVVLAGFERMGTAEARSAVEREVQAALALDAGLAAAHAVRGMAQLNFDWDWRAAEASFARALELNPGAVTAHMWRARGLTAQGRVDEAVAAARRAVELDPLSPIVRNILAQAYCYGRRWDRAAESAEQAHAMDRELASPLLLAGLARLGLGQAAAAVAHHEAAAADRQDLWALAMLGHTYARTGQPERARSVLSELRLRQGRGERVSPAGLAVVHGALGEADAAFPWLQRAYQERDDVLLWLKVHPVFDPLRADPRFPALQRRVGLPE
jgi:TolB-like protein